MRKLRCPECGRKSVVLRFKPHDGDVYECTLSRAGKAYTPCAWFAFAEATDSDDQREMARLKDANPQEDL